ncbi:MAG: DNA repair protein RecO [Candidatus Brocadiae bacterium]|nr:DNA repair protein RecO [Candidatus Brocadiia bacterium]
MIIQQEAIVLRYIDYGDSSQIFTLFTQDYGKIGVMAKGLKRNKNPYQGAMQVLNHLNVIYYPKKEGQLALFKECDIKSHFPAIRKDLPRLFTALYFVEFVREFTAEGDPNIRVFRLLRYALEQLSLGSIPQNMLLYLQWHTMCLLGINPNLEQCNFCQNYIALKCMNAFFSPASGLSYCQECQKHARGNLIVIPAITLQKIHVLVNTHNSRINQISLTSEEYQMVFQAFRLYLRFSFDKDLRLSRYLLFS